MSNPLAVIGHFFENLGKGVWHLVSPSLKSSFEAFLKEFVKDYVGATALAVVNVVTTLVPGGGVEARDAAVAVLKAQLIADGHDITGFAESQFNDFIENALQAIRLELTTDKTLTVDAAPIVKPAA